MWSSGGGVYHPEEMGKGGGGEVHRVTVAMGSGDSGWMRTHGKTQRWAAPRLCRPRSWACAVAATALRRGLSSGPYPRGVGHHRHRGARAAMLLWKYRRGARQPT